MGAASRGASIAQWYEMLDHLDGGAGDADAGASRGDAIRKVLHAYCQMPAARLHPSICWFLCGYRVIQTLHRMLLPIAMRLLQHMHAACTLAARQLPAASATAVTAARLRLLRTTPLQRAKRADAATNTISELTDMRTEAPTYQDSCLPCTGTIRCLPQLHVAPARLWCSISHSTQRQPLSHTFPRTSLKAAR
jgi:hypothetical protein